MDIDVEPGATGEAVVLVRGELDAATAGRLRGVVTALLNRGGVTAIGLDLRGLTFIDSTGIGTLVVAKRICGQVGVRLRVSAMSRTVAQVLGVTGVSPELEPSAPVAPRARQERSAPTGP